LAWKGLLQLAGHKLSIENQQYRYDVRDVDYQVFFAARETLLPQTIKLR
jgi:hypothetical protein